MPEFGSPFSGLTNDRKLTDEELVRAVRFAVTSEYEAVQIYTQLAESADDALAIEVFKSVADEERVHAGEFLHLLRALAPDEAELYAEGEKEVEEKKAAAKVDYDAVAGRAAGELHAALRKAPGGAPTADDLLSRAEDAIEKDEHFIYDVAADVGQSVDNVRHMRWFLRAVANWLIENTAKWSRVPLFD